MPPLFLGVDSLLRYHRMVKAHCSIPQAQLILLAIVMYPHGLSAARDGYSQEFVFHVRQKKAEVVVASVLAYIPRCEQDIVASRIPLLHCSSDADGSEASGAEIVSV